MNDSIKACLAAACLALPLLAQGAETLTIATVNNNDMIRMQRLSKVFEESHPDISLKWVVLEENVLRQRLTTDIATQGGQFDLLTIGTYEAALWGAKGWLEPMSGLPADYALDDLLPSVRDGLSVKGTLYALPFYAEASITYYRKDLFQQAGLRMPEQPTWTQLGEFAARLNRPDQGQYGICLRGKAGWGENMALIGTLANAFGARWFDERWQPEFSGGEWKKALDFYVSTSSGTARPAPPATDSTRTWRCSTAASARSGWTPASPVRSSPTRARARSPTPPASPSPPEVTDKGASWLYSWALAIPASSRAKDAAKAFATWATSQAYGKLVADREGVANVPPGTRASTYSEAYLAAAPFARVTLESLKRVDPNHPTLKPVPYVGIQLVTIPGVPGHRHPGRQAVLRRPHRADEQRPGARRRAAEHRPRDEARRLSEVVRRRAQLRPARRCSSACPEDPDGVAMNTSALDTPLPARPARRRLQRCRRGPGWLLVSPSVALLLLWMIVPLGMTLYFSLIRYNLLYPGENAFVGLENFTFFVTDAGFLPGALNTLLLVGSVLAISVAFGVLIAALLEAGEFFSRGAVRVLLISPFFIMPTVSALLWKNLIFHPVSGILAAVWRLFGAEPVDWLAHYPLLSIILIVSWQWLPFAILILMTAMQSLDQEQKEAARLDGAGPLAIFWHLTLAAPGAAHRGGADDRDDLPALGVRRDLHHHQRRPRLRIDQPRLPDLQPGAAAVRCRHGLGRGLIAVLIANIAAIVLVRMIGKNLTERS